MKVVLFLSACVIGEGRLPLGVQYRLPSRVSHYLGQEKREVFSGDRDCPLLPLAWGS